MGDDRNERVLVVESDEHVLSRLVNLSTNEIRPKVRHHQQDNSDLDGAAFHGDA